jgi:POT family proton-dependent oligopeptide transporter
MFDFLFLDGRPDGVLGYQAVKRGLEAVYGPLGPQPLAALIYGLYTALVYLTPLLGGFIADAVTGQKRAVLIGGVTMAAGEFLLTEPRLFFVGLLVLVLGNGFFKPNISTQVGGLYRAGDARIDRAYSIFYVGINLGALIAPIVTGRLGHSAPGEPPHWGLGFAAAGVGMILALVIFIAGWRTLPHDVRGRRRQSAAAGAPADRLTAADRRAILALVLVAVSNVFFWGCYEQQGISLALMAQNDCSLRPPFGTLKPEDIQAFRPFFIFTLTPVIIAFWARQAARGREPSSVTKMAIGCALEALGYAVLIVPGLAIDAGHKVGVIWLFGSIFLLTLGELYLSPVGLSLFSKASPAKVASLMMGVNLLSNFGGNYLAGYIGSFWEAAPKGAFFMVLTGILAGTALVTGLLSVWLNPILAARERRAAA